MFSRRRTLTSDQLPPLPPKQIPSLPTSISSNNNPIELNESTTRSRTTTGGKENKGFGKMISFPWGKSDKKVNANLPTSNSVSTPVITRVTGPASSTSLPLGFPSPPIPARQHSSSITPHLATPGGVKSIQSHGTMSTMASSFSLASTNLFTDEWESSNSIPSSPDGSPARSRKDGENVMWTVKGLSDSHSNAYTGIESEEEDRSTTPVPKTVLNSTYQIMMQDPTTPPPAKRHSITSSTPESTSMYNKATKMVRAASESSRSSPPNETSPDSPGDADDEVSPPRNKKRLSNKTLAEVSTLLERPFSSRTRIPSIRFEGISMEGVFAEVEKKMALEAEEKKGFGAEDLALEKKTRRRTKVFSIYRPMEDSISTTSSSSISEAPSVEEIKVLPVQTFRRPARSSSRPTPLNIVAANSTSIYTRTRSTTSPNSFSPPPLAGAFTLQPSRDSNGIFSPRIDGTFSNATPSPITPTATTPLGTAFQSIPSPALSTTSTFKIGIELPEVNVVPPTPTMEEMEEWSNPIDRSAGTIITKVVVLEERRTVRISTRASGARKVMERKLSVGEEESSTPPLSPALSICSTISNSTIDTPFATTFDSIPSLPSLTLPRLASTEEDEITDEFSSMLIKLNRPHTPPPTILITSSSTGSLAAMAVESPSKGGSDSDDSMARFGDAPQKKFNSLTQTILSNKPTPINHFSENLSSSSSDELDLSESEGYDSIDDDNCGEEVEIRIGERIEINGYEMGMAM